jgi:hypothetical protein
MQRRLRLLVRRKKKGIHCSNWANMLERPSVMRRFGTSSFVVVFVQLIPLDYHLLLLYD